MNAAGDANNLRMAKGKIMSQSSRIRRSSEILCYGLWVLILLSLGCVATSHVQFESGQAGSIDAEIWDVSITSSENEHSIAGVHLLKKGRWDEAKSEFGQAVAENPDDHRSFFGMGLACEKCGDHDGAAANYRRAIELTSPGKREYIQAMYQAGHRVRGQTKSTVSAQTESPIEISE